MRKCASRRKTGLLRQTIVATRRKRSQMRTRQASPDPGPLQGSLFRAPRSGCQAGPLKDRRASYLIGRHPASGRCRRFGPTSGRTCREETDRSRCPALPRARPKPGLRITRRCPEPVRLRSARLPRRPRRPLQPRPARCRTGSAFPSRSARRRCDDGWRGMPGPYRPGSGGRQ